MGKPTLFVEDASVTARALEVTGASFTTGMNIGASNAPGIGINEAGGALPDKDTDAAGWNWTLTDQDEAARTPQVGQLVGGDGYVNRTVATGSWDGSGGKEGKGTTGISAGTNPANVEGAPNNDATITIGEDMDLAVLATGWVETTP